MRTPYPETALCKAADRPIVTPPLPAVAVGRALAAEAVGAAVRRAAAAAEFVCCLMLLEALKDRVPAVLADEAVDEPPNIADERLLPADRLLLAPPTRPPVV